MNGNKSADKDLHNGTSEGKQEIVNQTANDLDPNLAVTDAQAQAEVLRTVEIENAPDVVIEQIKADTLAKRSRPSTASARLVAEKPGKQVRIDLKPSRPSTASAGSVSKPEKERSRPATGSLSNRSRLMNSPQRSRPGTGSQRSRFSSPRSRPNTGSRPGSRTVGLGVR